MSLPWVRDLRALGPVNNFDTSECGRGMRAALRSIINLIFDIFKFVIISSGSTA